MLRTLLRGVGSGQGQTQQKPSEDSGDYGMADGSDNHGLVELESPAVGGNEHQRGQLIGGLQCKVELREISGALDRRLAVGPLRILQPPSRASPRTGPSHGHGHAQEQVAVLQVGRLEVPLGRGEPGAPFYTRIDPRTFKLHLASSPTPTAPAPAGPAHDGLLGSSAPAAPSPLASSSSLLLLFPRDAPHHDVARTEAVLQDLATGRGSMASFTGPMSVPGPGMHDSVRLHGRHTAAAAAASQQHTGRGGSGGGGANGANVLLHDDDPAHNLGWRNSHPVRLTHLERVPPRPQHPQQPLSHARQQQAMQGADGSGGEGGDMGRRGSFGQGARAAQGAEVGSPGGTRLGKLRGLGLGSVWGSASVANLAYEKDVRVRYSLDGWASYGEVSANWDKRLGLGADNFNFAIDLDAAGQQHGVAVRTTLAAGNHVTLSLAVHYVVAGQSHWDSNDAANYTFDLPCE